MAEKLFDHVGLILHLCPHC